jgi:hypothetical protein
VRQGAHLVRDNGESAPLLTGPGRFDRRIQGKQVGLLRDTANDIQDAADVLGFLTQGCDGIGSLFELFSECFDRLYGLLDDLPSVVRQVVRLLG